MKLTFFTCQTDQRCAVEDMPSWLSAGTDRSEDEEQALWSHYGEEYNLKMLAGKSIPYSNEGTGPDRRICKFHVRATPDGNFFEVYHEVITGQYTHFDPRPIHRHRRRYQLRAGAAAVDVQLQHPHLSQAPSNSHAGELEAEPMSSFSADALHDEVVEVTHNLCEAFSEHEESGGQKIPQITQMLEQVKECSRSLDAIKLRRSQGQSSHHKIVCLGMETAGKSTLINQLLWLWSPWVRGESSNSMEQPEQLTQVTREELKSEAPTLYNYSQVSKEEILKRALKETEREHRSRIIGKERRHLNRVGKQGLAPAKSGQEPCTGPTVEYTGCPELMEGEVILAGMAAKDARKLEEELHSKLKLRQDEQDDLGRQDEVDKQEEDAVLAQYKALMGLPNSYDRAEVLECSRVLPCWTRDFLGKATTFKTQSPTKLLEFLAANTAGDNAPWALWESVQVKVPSLEPFCVVDVPGLSIHNPYQFEITRSFLESIETDLVLLLLPCGSRRPLTENFDSLRNCHPFFSRLIARDSTVTLRTVRCLTRDDSCSLGAAVQLLNETGDVRLAVADAVEIIQKSEAHMRSRPSWKLWLLEQLRSHVEGLEDMSEADKSARLQNLTEARFPASSVDITDCVLGIDAFKGQEELDPYRIEHLAKTLLKAQEERGQRGHDLDQLEVLRVTARVLTVAHAAINVEAMHSSAASHEAAKQRLRTLAANAQRLQHQIGEASWERLIDERTRAAAGNAVIGIGHGFSDSTRVANTLKQYAKQSAERCDAAKSLGGFKGENQWKDIPNLEVRYNTKGSRTLNDHLLSEVLSFPCTPLPQIIAKDVVQSLPETLKEAGLRWFTTAAENLERHFLDQGMRVLGRAQVELNDGLSAILMSAQLELAQRMHHHVRGIIGRVRLAFERLAGAGFEEVLKKKMAPRLKAIKKNGGNNTLKTQLLLKEAPSIAKEVALELVTSIWGAMTLQKDELREAMSMEMDRLINILKTGMLPSVTEQLAYIHTTCGEAVVRLAPLLTGHENALRVAMGEDFWMVEGTLAIATRAQGRDVYTVLNLRKDRLEAMPVPEQPEVLPHGAPNDHAAKRRKVLNPNTNGRVCSWADCEREAMKKGPRINWPSDEYPGVPCQYHRNMVRRAQLRRKLTLIAGAEETEA